MIHVVDAIASIGQYLRLRDLSAEVWTDPFLLLRRPSRIAAQPENVTMIDADAGR